MTGETVDVVGVMRATKGKYVAGKPVDLSPAATDNAARSGFSLYFKPAIPKRGGGYQCSLPGPLAKIFLLLDKLSMAGVAVGVKLYNTAHHNLNEIAHRCGIPPINRFASTFTLAGQVPIKKTGWFKITAQVSACPYLQGFKQPGIAACASAPADRMRVDRTIDGNVTGFKITKNCINPVAIDLLHDDPSSKHDELAIERDNHGYMGPSTIQPDG